MALPGEGGGGEEEEGVKAEVLVAGEGAEAEGGEEQELVMLLKRTDSGLLS